MACGYHIGRILVSIWNISIIAENSPGQYCSREWPKIARSRRGVYTWHKGTARAEFPIFHCYLPEIETRLKNEKTEPKETTTVQQWSRTCRKGKSQKKKKKKKSPNSIQKCCASLLLTLKPCARQTPTSPAKAKSKITPASHYRKTDFGTWVQTV